jgi:hypothetical protein
MPKKNNSAPNLEVCLFGPVHDSGPGPKYKVVAWKFIPGIALQRCAHVVEFLVYSFSYYTLS